MLGLGCLFCSKQFVHQPVCRKWFSSYKMVLVVRQDISMTKGKMGAQCSHAAVASFELGNAINKKLWKLNGQAKIVLQCDSEKSLLEIYKQAKSNKLPASLICDAGRTQLDPGTYTVVGIGPASTEDIDNITGHLKLF